MKSDDMSSDLRLDSKPVVCKDYLPRLSIHNTRACCSLFSYGIICTRETEKQCWRAVIVQFLWRTYIADVVIFDQ